MPNASTRFQAIDNHRSRPALQEAPIPELNQAEFPLAVQAFQSLLGTDSVSLNEEELRRSSTTTFATSVRVCCILKPSSRAQVSGCVAIANRYRVPVYTVSSGRNWGYGSRVPTSDQCALLDLGGLREILDFDSDLGCVTVEPGVTQQQLFEFLQARGGRYWIDATGSSRASSVIGNTVERGFGHTPYGDHFANCCALEVVTASGEVIRTGLGRFPGAKAAPAYRWGLGPSLDGLFSQSNLGIVISLTIWLMPAPEYFQAFFFRCDREEALPEIIDALRPLRLNGTLRSAAHIGNGYKVLSGLQQYPWREAGGKTPLQPAQLAEFGRKLNFGVWNGSGALYGTRGQVAEARGQVRRALAGKVSHLRFIDDRMLGLLERYARPLSWITRWDLSRALSLLRPVYELMKGVPTDHALQSTYWRKKNPVPVSMDPDRDGCGLIWCAPVAPLSGAHARQVTAIASACLLRHGFEPLISLTLLTERSLACIISIAFDRDLPGEDEKAERCHQELVGQLVREGYYFYRLGLSSMHVARADDSYGAVLSRIKQALDPNGILSPARYQGIDAKTAAREYAERLSLPATKP